MRRGSLGQDVSECAGQSNNHDHGDTSDQPVFAVTARINAGIDCSAANWPR